MAENKRSLDDLMISKEIDVQPPEIQDEVDRFLKADDDFENLETKAEKTLQDLEIAFYENDTVKFKILLTRLLCLDIVSETANSQDLIAYYEGLLQSSPAFTEEFKANIMNALRRSLDRYKKQSEIVESNEREKLASFLRSQNARDLKALFKAIWKSPGLRKKLQAINGDRKKLVQGAFREGDVFDLDGFEQKDSGELQKIMAPIFELMIKDLELRYYLNLAIDTASKKRSKELLEEIEEEPNFYIPSVIVGFGVYGQVINNELMHAVPEIAAENVLTIDNNPWIGGQFAVGTKAFFNVNNRVRPERKDSQARPGTKDNIMPLGRHAVVDLPRVTAKTYPSQNLLGSCLKTNGYLNSRKYLLNSRVSGFKKNPDSAKKGKYIVNFVDRTSNKAYQVFTDRIDIADGPGENSYGFENQYDVATRRIVAESRKNLSEKGSALYYTFNDVVATASNEEISNWRKRFQGEGIIAGAGDSGIVCVSGLLGYGPDEHGTTQADFTSRITWIGQPAADSEEWCKLSRPRYVDIAREFPRPKKDKKAEQAKLSTSETYDDQKILYPPLSFAQLCLEDPTEENFRKLGELIVIEEEEEGNKLNISGDFNLKNINAIYAAIVQKEFSLRSEVQVKLANAESVLENFDFVLSVTQDDLNSLSPARPSNPNPMQYSRSLVERLSNLSVALGRDNFINLFPSLEKIFNINNTFGFNRPLLETIKATIKVQKKIYSAKVEELKKLIAPVTNAEPTTSTDDEENENCRQKFARINPLGTPPVLDPNGVKIREANTDADGNKIFRATRMEKFISKDASSGNKERIRVYYTNEKGEEESVEGDWVIDATGLKKKTDRLFIDFDTSQSAPLNLNMNLMVDYLSFEGTSINFEEEGNKNPFLNGLEIEVNEGSCDKAKKVFYSKITASTNKGTEYILEVIANFDQDNQITKVEVINSDTSIEATKVASALQIWLLKRDIGKVKELKTRDKKLKIDNDSEFNRTPIEVEDPEILLPVASQLQYRGDDQDIYFTGPTNNFALTVKEKETVPALADVSQNLASMFRYVPATAAYAKENLATYLTRNQQAYPIDQARYSDVRKLVKKSRRRSKDILNTNSEFKIKFDNLSLPNAVSDIKIFNNFHIFTIQDALINIGIEPEEIEKTKIELKLTKTQSPKGKAKDFQWTWELDPSSPYAATIWQTLIDCPQFFSGLQAIVPRSFMKGTVSINLGDQSVNLERQLKQN